MKTIFDTDTHSELHDRLGKLSPDAARKWGRMTPSQMMEHTARVLEMATSEDQPLKQVFLGKAIAWIFKGSFLGEKPFGKNAPTGPDYIIKDDPDFDATRERLKDLITKFHSF